MSRPRCGAFGAVSLFLRTRALSRQGGTGILALASRTGFSPFRLVRCAFGPFRLVAPALRPVSSLLSFFCPRSALPRLLCSRPVSRLARPLPRPLPCLSPFGSGAPARLVLLLSLARGSRDAVLSRVHVPPFVNCCLLSAITSGGLSVFALSSQFPGRNVKIVACGAALPYRLLFPKWQWYTYQIQGRCNALRSGRLRVGMEPEQ